MDIVYFLSWIFTLVWCTYGDNITVTFNDTKIIKCQNDEVIDIVNITVVDHAKMCSHESCTLNIDEKTAIQQQCNGYSSCNISSQTECLQDTGYFDFDYTCQDILPLSCDFEQGLCGWTAHVGTVDSTYIWKSGKRDRLTSSNGPSRDHTLNTSAGTYVYTDASNGFYKDETYFISRYIQPSQSKCLTFWYYVHGDDDDILSLHYNVNGRTQWVNIWSASRTSESRWIYQKIDLQDIDSDYRIGFMAVSGDISEFVAIDDIIIASKRCNATELDCNFETDCQWLTTTGSYKWRKKTKGTDTWNTGPDHDHTTGLSVGIYGYLEASHIDEGTEANLSSHIMEGLGDFCLTFWYHMYGNQMGELRVYKIIGEHMYGLWNISGNQDKYWHQAFVDIYSHESFKIVFSGKRGSGRRSDIAIDDISLIQQTCSEFQGVLSHLTIETQETSSYTQTCINVDYTFEIHDHQCSDNQVQFYQSKLSFHPQYEGCIDVYDDLRKHAEKSCSKMRPSESCALNFSPSLQHNRSCFISNSMLVEYICTDINLPTKEEQTQGEQNKAVTVGVVAGLVILACVLVVIIFVSKRYKHCNKGSKKPTSQHNDMVDLAATGDYTGTQDIALPNALGHVTQLAITGDQQYDEIGSAGNRAHTHIDIGKTADEQTHSSYEYVDSERNVNCYPISKDIGSTDNESQYSFARDDNSESRTTEAYTVLDPNETGFNRSNIPQHVPNDDYYQTDGCTNIMVNDLNAEIDDQYELSKDGTYDTSNNKRHKKTEDTIYSHTVDGVYDDSSNNNRLKEIDDIVYSHTVDSVYDTSSHKRTEQNENAYDHFFEERSGNGD